MKIKYNHYLQWILLVGTRRDDKMHKSCRSFNSWDGSVVVLASSVCSIAWGNSTFTSVRFCQLHYLTRVRKHYPMLTLQPVGLSTYNRKSVSVKSWNFVREKRTKVPILDWRDTVEYFREKSMHFKIFFQHHQVCQLQPKTFVPPNLRNQ